MLACHTCNNRRCVNPGHVYEGTHKQNTADMIRAGRAYCLNQGPRRKRTEPKVKLTVDQAQEIKRRYDGTNGRALAVEFGVSRVAVYNATSGRSWKSTGLI